MFAKLTIVTLLLLHYSHSFPGKTCKVPNADAGTCTPVHECDPLYLIYNNRKRGQGEEVFLRQSAGSCGNRGNQVKVCCPPKSQWSDLIVSPVPFEVSEKPISSVPATTVHDSPTMTTASATTSTVANALAVAETTPSPITTPTLDKLSVTDKFNKWLTKWRRLMNNSIQCGTQFRSLNDRFVSYRKPDIDEYPWMALLEYGPKEYKCGGTLISLSHVLTAAHCLYSSPTKVRLSEYNITSDFYDEGYADGGKVETITVMILEVQHTVIHPDHVFGTSQNDVGLIKMKYTIFSTDYVRPICLPEKDYSETGFNSKTKLFVSGWGSDDKYVNSEVKKSILLPYVPFKECLEKFPTQIRRDQHICAGGQEGVDSCRGDSGGPLMYEFDKASFTIVGIVSSGASKCGTKDHPGIYMYVYNYVNWITRTIYNDEERDRQAT